MSAALSRSRLSHFILAVAAGLLAGACQREDPRVASLAPGLSKDSVVTVMGGSPPEQPYSYLVDGQFIEAMIYRRDGAEGPIDSLDRGDLTPVILVDGKLTGWGWEHWDSVAGAHRIEVRPPR